MSNLITREFLGGQLDFWGKLDGAVQKTVQAETVGVVEDFNRGIKGFLAVGRHLKVIKAALVLEAGREGRWMRYCKNVLPFTYRTAERYIERFEKIEGVVPERVIEAAIARGVDLVGGDFSEPLKQLPPPKDPTPKQAVEWIEKAQELVRNTPRSRHKARRRVDVVKVEVRAFRAVVTAYKSLPAGKGRHSWAVALVGKLLTELGLAGQKVEAEAVPAGYRPVPVGRPRKAVASTD